MSDEVGTPLTEIFEILKAMQGTQKEILARLDKLEGNAPPKPEPEPQKQEPAFLADFVKPVPIVPRHGAGTRMSAPDGEELIQRALYSVRWNGDVMSHIAEEAWAEIELVKAGDPKITPVYAGTGADPELIATLLLTGYISPVGYDQYSFNVAQEQRRKLVNQTPQSWIKDQFDIMLGTPVVSGGDAPE